MVPTKDRLRISKESNTRPRGAIGYLRIATIPFASNRQRPKPKHTLRVINRSIDIAPGILRVQIDPTFQKLGIARNV
jgi:hypothetical protein